MFDDKLDWSAHMDYVMKKLRKMNAFRVSNLWGMEFLSQ